MIKNECIGCLRKRKTRTQFKRRQEAGTINVKKHENNNEATSHRSTRVNCIFLVATPILARIMPIRRGGGARRFPGRVEELLRASVGVNVVHGNQFATTCAWKLRGVEWV